MPKKQHRDGTAFQTQAKGKRGPTSQNKNFSNGVVDRHCMERYIFQLVFQVALQKTSAIAWKLGGNATRHYCQNFESQYLKFKYSSV